MDEIKKLCKKIYSYPLSEGANKTKLPYLTIHMSSQEKTEMPKTENFYVYVLLDGSLRLHSPSEISDYNAGQFFVSKTDTPRFGNVLAFSDRGYFLSLAVEFTLNEAISVILDLDDNLVEKIANSKLDAADMSVCDKKAVSSIARLFSIMDEPVSPAFMGKHIKREILFFILCGSFGSQFLQSVANVRKADEIYEINSWIKKNFRNSFTVEELALRQNMSVSLFHRKFKSAVGMAPLQCQKRLRLTEARRLMLDEKKNVTEASLEVGYESVSQFARDYRKMFGMAPKEDIAGLRGKLKK